MRGSELSTRGFIPWFGLPQRRPYVHVVETLTKSIVSRQSSLNREHNHGHLDPDLKGDCPRRRGLRPPHNVVDAAPHQVGGSLTCRRATKAPRRPAHQDTMLVQLRTTAQESKLCLITHSRANLALTLTKLVLRTKDMIFMLLDGLEVFLGVCRMSSNSSKLQMAGGAHI